MASEPVSDLVSVVEVVEVVGRVSALGQVRGRSDRPHLDQRIFLIAQANLDLPKPPTLAELHLNQSSRFEGRSSLHEGVCPCGHRGSTAGFCQRIRV